MRRMKTEKDTKAQQGDLHGQWAAEESSYPLSKCLALVFHGDLGFFHDYRKF